MSWTDTRGTVPSPDLSLSKWFFHVFLQCFPSGCYSGTTADGGWCPAASGRCLGAKVCQICQLGHRGTQCSWQAGYSGKTATEMTSHCSSEKKQNKKLAHQNVCCYRCLTVGEGGDNILGRTVKFHSTSGTVITFCCQGITQRAWNIFHRQDNCLTFVIKC